jgi:hypothetical protein
MKQFTPLNRAELKDILGGRVDPKDEVECMSKTKGDACGDGGGQCLSIRNSAPHDGFHLICRSINVNPA